MRGEAAAAVTLAAVLAVLLGFGAAGAVTSSGPGARASAAAAAGAADAGPSGPAGAQPAGPGFRAPGASDPAAATSDPAAATSDPAAATSDPAGATPGTSAAGHSRRAAARRGTIKSGDTAHGTSRRGASAASASHAAAHRAAPALAPAQATVSASGTSCRSVAHIGDSTSVGLVSPLDLPDPAQRLAAQYRDVGVRHSWIDASGGRSMVEEMPGQVNGYNTARNMASRGFRGCWVVALGTNDTANVSVGSGVGRMARIQELMSVAHGAPVMWVNVKTLDPSGPWSEANMRVWNDTLLQACQQYPNLRIFDWASAAQDGWFISDGIHYTPAGYAVRAHLIARALARAFPRSGASTSCVIR
jgi:hypothetical protein